jgi:hypothetical protein
MVAPSSEWRSHAAVSWKRVLRCFRYDQELRKNSASVNALLKHTIVGIFPNVHWFA